MQRISISVLLGLVFAAIVVPIVLFVILLIGQLQDRERSALETRTWRDTLSISRAVEPIISEMSSTLGLVTSAGDLRSGNLSAFHARTQTALEGTGNFIIVVDAEGNQLLNTRGAFGRELPKTADLEGLRTALASGSDHISHVFRGGASGKWVFNVLKPLPAFINSKSRAVITTRDAADMLAPLQPIDLPPGWTAAILDQGGNAVASTNPQQVPTGAKVSLPGGRTVSGPTNTIEANDANILDDQMNVVAHAAIGSTGWRSVIWGPVASAQTSVLQAWRMLLIGGLVLLGLSLLILYAFWWYLTQTVSRIAAMATGVGEGSVVSPATSRIREFDLMARALSDASYDRSQRENTVTNVMRELAHRTKNLITVVISIVRQSGISKLAGGQDATSALTQRIMGLGYSIDLLTAREWGSVDLQELLERQLGTFGAVGSSIRLKGPSIAMRAEAVQHMGMAIHELGTNAVKYGGLSEPDAYLDIEWSVTPPGPDAAHPEGTFNFLWRERGGPKVEKPEKAGFGSMILDRLVAAAITGTTSTMEYQPDGFVWTLVAPADQMLHDTAM